MKKITLLSILCFLLLTALQAQTPPNAFNYSAVARNASGQPIAQKTIGIQITILKTSTAGASQYVENHFVNTDQYGLFNLVVGAGAVQSGSMSAINWSNDNYYLKVGMDANGGTSFLTMGTTQLLSVPYALYAKTAGGTVNSNDNDTSASNELQTLSMNNDTIYLSNGGFVKLKDNNSTNELQTLSIKNDTIFLTNGGFVKLPSGGTGGNFTHYIGEQFGGGVIFHLWKDAQGSEHGLIVDKIDLSGTQNWSNIQSTIIGGSAQSKWDGLSNSNAIVGQAGHTASAASLCLNSTNGGKSDWYLPSIDELSILWYNRYNVNKTLSTIGGAVALQDAAYYWSSSELTYNLAWNFFFFNGTIGSFDKINEVWVRAVRAF